MSDVLTGITQHIQTLLSEPAATEQGVVAAAAQAADLISKYHSEAHDDTTQRATFDRAEQLALVPADYCLKGIGALCRVKATTCLRVERSRFGGEHPVRLLALVGAEADMEFAHALYNMIDGTVGQAVVRYRQTHQHSNQRQWTEIGTAMAARINLRLKHLAGCDTEQQTRLVA